MNVSRSTWIAGLMILIGVATVAALFKPVQVNSADWRKQYRPDGEGAYDVSVFRGLLDRYYGEDRVISCRGACGLPDSSATGVAYIYISENYYPDSLQDVELSEFVRAGGDALILAEYFEWWDGMPAGIYPDMMIDSIEAITLSGNEVEYYYENLQEGTDSTAWTYVYGLTQDSTVRECDTLLMAEDSILLSAIYPMDSGRLILHTLPEMYTNVTLKHGDGVAHLNYILEQLDVDTVYFDTAYNQYRNNNYSSFNPLAFIFENPGLKWAYLLLLLTALSYIYFTGKRRQRYIATLPASENGSLAFVDTLSDLYRMQNQPNNLVQHLEDNLYQYIRRRYFIDRQVEHFVDRVASKSRVPAEQIALLIKKLESAKDNPRFREEQLVNLHKRLEEFYTQSK